MAMAVETTESEEMVLKYMWLLQHDDDGTPAKTGQLAEYIQVSPSSVTEMLDKLQGKGLAEHRKYEGSSLTKEGERIAVSILKRHCVMEWFMVQVLEVPEGQFHDEACEMEHVLTDSTAAKLRGLTDQPDTCPSCYDLERLHCRHLVPGEVPRR
ncbi:MAG: metal-dependent transcriptional regulator [Thermoplasmata archaeon]